VMDLHQQLSAGPFSGDTKSILDGLREIHGPIPLTGWPAELLIGTALFFLPALALLFLVWRRRRRPTPPPLPAPWEKALRELDEASCQRKPEQALSYMARVSQILRGYLEARFGITSTCQTTDELLLALKGKCADSASLHSEIEICLRRADLAKFARLPPEADALVEVESQIRRLIEKSRPETAGEGP
ncbi:MAG: DUF4381 family protein, partial [Desulforhopalus sp.]|nr:DUF4381 family protein [Desulforhopalus sp.]